MEPVQHILGEVVAAAVREQVFNEGRPDGFEILKRGEHFGVRDKRIKGYGWLLEEKFG